MAAALIGLLFLGLFIMFIIGMVKPKLILRWDKNPNRWKVFGFSTLAFIFIGILSVFIVPTTETIRESKIAIAKNHLQKKEFDKALTTLNQIEKEDSLYQKAQKLIVKVDSLKAFKVKQEKIAIETKAKKEAKSKTQEQIERLQKEIKSINEGIDFSAYRDSKDYLLIELAIFSNWGDLIKKGMNSKNEKIQNLATQLKSKVQRIQKQEFPKMRENYADVVAELMWKFDIYVTATGSRNQYINLSGGLFATNKNKLDFQNQLIEMFELLRYSQSRYRWYKEADEYTYWTIYEGNDSDFVL